MQFLLKLLANTMNVHLILNANFPPQMLWYSCRWLSCNCFVTTRIHGVYAWLHVWLKVFTHNIYFY